MDVKSVKLMYLDHTLLSASILLEMTASDEEINPQNLEPHIKKLIEEGYLSSPLVDTFLIRFQMMVNDLLNFENQLTKEK